MRPDALRGRPHFRDLTPLHPRHRMRLERPSGGLTSRVVDLIAPIGKGQRGLIVAPPKTGKTVLLQQLAAAVAENHPASSLMVVLIDERPEEVTDMRRSVRGEVLASTFDRPHERAHRPRRTGSGTRQTPRRAGPGRRPAPRLPHPPVPGAQQRRHVGRPNAERRCGRRRAPRPEEALRRGTSRGRGRVADHPRHGAGGDRFPGRRLLLRGIEEHRQYGTPSGPRAHAASGSTRRSMSPPRAPGARNYCFRKPS